MKEYFLKLPKRVKITLIVTFATIALSGLAFGAFYIFNSEEELSDDTQTSTEIEVDDDEEDKVDEEVLEADPVISEEEAPVEVIETVQEWVDPIIPSEIQSAVDIAIRVRNKLTPYNVPRSDVTGLNKFYIISAIGEYTPTIFEAYLPSGYSVEYTVGTWPISGEHAWYQTKITAPEGSATFTFGLLYENYPHPTIFTHSYERLTSDPGEIYRGCNVGENDKYSCLYTAGGDPAPGLNEYNNMTEDEVWASNATIFIPNSGTQHSAYLVISCGAQSEIGIAECDKFYNSIVPLFK